MNDNIRVIADKEDIVAIADAVREKLGSTIEMSLGEIVTNINKIGSGSTVDLDAEVTAQENIITSQDTLIASIASALEGKAAGGGSGTTFDFVEVTINLDVADGMSVDMYAPIVNENGEITSMYETIVSGTMYRFPKIGYLMPPVMLSASYIGMYNYMNISANQTGGISMGNTDISESILLYTTSECNSTTLTITGTVETGWM